MSTGVLFQFTAIVRVLNFVLDCRNADHSCSQWLLENFSETSISSSSPSMPKPIAVARLNSFHNDTIQRGD
jgi:hypothetical protein